MKEYKEKVECPECGKKVKRLKAHQNYCGKVEPKVPTRQEEIREVIDKYTDDGCLYPEKACVRCSKEGYCASDNDSYTCLMKRLDELDVVIKVEAKMPQFQSRLTEEANWALLLKGGWSATVPLVEK